VVNHTLADLPLISAVLWLIVSSRATDHPFDVLEDLYKKINIMHRTRKASPCAMSKCLRSKHYCKWFPARSRLGPSPSRDIRKAKGSRVSDLLIIIRSPTSSLPDTFLLQNFVLYFKELCFYYDQGIV
jgi:hypothetical protein